MHGQYGTSGHSVVTGTYVFPPHFSVDINERPGPSRLSTAHVTHVSSELIGIALTGPTIHTSRIVEWLIDVVKTFELIIPEHWNMVLNELGCYRSGQLRPLGLT